MTDSAAALAPTTFSHSWTFGPGVLPEYVGPACCEFERPFWAPAKFHVDGNTRTVTLADGTVLTETLQRQLEPPMLYTYVMSGMPGISDYAAQFETGGSAGAAELTWSGSFQAADASSAARMEQLVESSAGDMTAALAEMFPS